jgi:hypothetical protein
MFPGPQSRPDLLNRELLERRPLLPARLESPRGDLAATRPLLRLGVRNLDHPVASLWREPDAGSLDGPAFFRVMSLTPVPGESRTVLAYSDGSPAVLERTFGRGRVLLFSSTANTLWNDLPLRPAVFVPLLYRSLSFALASADDTLNIPVGRPFEFAPPNDWLGREVETTPPGPAETVQPETRRVELADGRARLVFDATDRAGVYRSKLLGAAADQAGASVTFAAQRDPTESDLTPLGPAERQALAESLRLVDYADRGAASLAVTARDRAGREFWAVLAVVVLMLALTESLLAQRFSRPK